MAKRKTSNPQQKPGEVVINDFSIEVRTIDRSTKDLARWKSALLSAESVLNPTRKLLYDLYEDITLDEHLTSVSDQRRLPLTNASLLFQKDGKEVEAITALIDTLAFEKLIKFIADSKFYGFSLIRADFTAPTGPNVELVPRPHVIPEKSIVVRNPGDQSGICYLEPPYTHLYLGVGEPKDLGLYLKAAPLVLLKRGNVSDWASFNEVFGQPMRKATYSPGDPTQKAQLEQAMANMGSLSWVVVPEGSNVEIVGNYQSASADTYSKLTSHFDEAISKLIVGQTMTTESGASLSQSEVHERVASQVGQSDRRFVLKVLNSIVVPMLQAQGIPADGTFQYVEEEQTVSKKDRLTGDLAIHKTVGALTKEYYAEEYNVVFESMEPEQGTESDEGEVDEGEEEAKADKKKSGDTSKLSAKQESWLKRNWQELASFFEQAPTQ